MNTLRWNCLEKLGCLRLLVLFLAGCNSGPPVGELSGKVTYRGQPVTAGSVVFESAAGGEAVSASLAPDGSFFVRTHERAGLVVGAYKIAVTPTQIGSGEAPLAVAPGENPPPASVIPPKYHTTAKSGLSVAVKAGVNPPLELQLVD